MIVLVASCDMFKTSETAGPAGDEPIVLTGGEIIVTIGEDGELLYAPEDVSVSVGDTVVWENKSGAHDVVFGTVPDGVDAEAISLTTLATESGPAHSVTFENSGTYKYHCTPHKELGMFGTVTVE
ncbi:MAG: plastocyanin [Symploca sp. SIO2G7]|nr:plastocyanin [Symploca sp. SIO2G7]